ncbi:MAG: GNAT family N-acetyltransferase [Chloroflexota bacterium]
MIRYTTTVENIISTQLEGFFVNWPNPPSPETHLDLLRHSDAIVLAIDDATNAVVGFVTAHTDKVLTAYVPLLEVLPNYQKQGIGLKLMQIILENLRSFYAIDLLCDSDVQPFYERVGMRPATGMYIRHYENQSGRKDT